MINIKVAHNSGNALGYIEKCATDGLLPSIVRDDLKNEKGNLKHFNNHVYHGMQEINSFKLIITCGKAATVSIHSYFQIIDDACGTFVFFANTNLQEN